MASIPRPLVAGNWKMNGLRLHRPSSPDHARRGEMPRADLMICPPATLIAALRPRRGARRLAIGGQDCHAEPSGAFTGDISAEMLADAGASAVIVGHSERRTDHHETDADVRAKAQAAWRAGLWRSSASARPKAEREAGQALDVVGRQLAGSVPDGATRRQSGGCL